MIGVALLAAACARAPRTLDVPPATRLVVVAPHPDDETLAAGGLIQRVRASGGTVRVVVLTPGDGYLEAAAAASGHAEPTAADYRALGDRRLRELGEGLEMLGLPVYAVTFVGGPDDGLAALWSDNWPATAPYVSPHTGRGPASGEQLLAALEIAIAEAAPTVVVIPDPRDAHPDHAAAGRFALAALPKHRPPVVLTYFVHDPLWPPPLSAGSHMPPPPDRELAGTQWVSFSLTPDEQAMKAHALHAHASQWPVNGGLLERFLRQNEVFALASPP